MSRSYPVQPEHVSVEGMGGINRVRFLATIKHGNGTRQVAVDVPPEVILKLAECIETTADGACDGEHYRISRDPGQRYVAGHAVWHFNHPDAPCPCIDHSKVIDMNVLPSGDDDDGGT